MNCNIFVNAASRFEAARALDFLPAGHRSRQLHGHSFLAKLRVRADDATWADFPGDEVDSMRRRLNNYVSTLDYRLLNDVVAVPTDENLARFIATAADDLSGVDVVGVQSTPTTGADLDHKERARVWRKFRFEAAHWLPNVPADHQCGRLHGHGFEVILHASKRLDGDPMAVDSDTLIDLWRPLHSELHYACLNDVTGLENPTSENLAGWIWKRIKPSLPELSWVTVYETATAGCHFDGSLYRIWKEQRFESALSLEQAPAGDPRRRLHGHSYVIRLHLSAPLDDILGWTVDYGDVKALFGPVHEQLDHRSLNEIDEIRASDSINVLKWIHRQIESALPQLDRIDLFETPGCGASLRWGTTEPALPIPTS